jgi:hypothetical protein
MSRRLLRVSAALGTAAAIALAPATAAAALIAAKPYTDHNDSGWSHPVRKPADIYFGMGGAPWLASLKWRDWGRASAYAQGQLWALVDPLCVPVYACPYGHRWASVRLTDPATRRGRKWFLKMAVRYYSDGTLQIRHLVMDGHGYWTGPAVPPYF